LLQNNEENQEQPVAFFSRDLRDVELRYISMENQAYSLVKVLKSCRYYILQSKIIAYVPTSAIKEILIQSDIEGRMGKWITKLQDYDL
jgi:hypothetical protein